MSIPLTPYFIIFGFILFFIALLVTMILTRKRKSGFLFAALGQFFGGTLLLVYVLDDWLKSLPAAFALWLLTGSLQDFKCWLKNMNFKCFKKNSCSQNSGPNNKTDDAKSNTGNPHSVQKHR